MTKTLMGASRPQAKLLSATPEAALFSPRTKQSLVQWPTEQQLQEVSRQLVKIKRVGIRSEVNGDYFKSGDLAYQILEIIRATAELLKKSQRAKG